MKKATKGIYTFEQILYTLLLVPMFIGHLLAILQEDFLLFSMFCQLLIGIAQLLSGLLHLVTYNDQKRAKYLGRALVFVILLIFGSIGLEYIKLLGDGITVFIGILFVIIIPSGIAIWYTIQTNMDRKLAKPAIKKNKQIKQNEDLLDDIQITR